MGVGKFKKLASGLFIASFLLTGEEEVGKSLKLAVGNAPMPHCTTIQEISVLVVESNL